MGASHTYKKNYTTALTYLEKLIPLIELPKQNELYLETTDYMGCCYTQTDQYKKAIDVFEKGEPFLNNWKNEDDIERKIWYFLTKGTNYSCLDDHKNSFKSYKSASDIYSSSDINNDKLLSVINLRFLKSFMFLEKINGVDSVIEKININLLSENEKSEFISSVLLRYHYTDDFEKSIIEYNRYKNKLDLNSGSNENENIASIYSRVGITSYMLKNYIKSYLNFTKCKQYCDEETNTYQGALNYIRIIREILLVESIQIITVILLALGCIIIIFNKYNKPDIFLHIAYLPFYLFASVLILSFILRKRNFNWYVWFKTKSLGYKVVYIIFMIVPLVLSYIL